MYSLLFIVLNFNLKICDKIFLTVLHDLWDLCSQTRDQTQTLRIESMKSYLWTVGEFPRYNLYVIKFTL